MIRRSFVSVFPYSNRPFRPGRKRMDSDRQAPWWLRLIGKLFGILFFAIGAGLTQMPRLVDAREWWASLIFFAGAALFVLIGALFWKSKPPPLNRTCPACGRENQRSRLVIFCFDCGHALCPPDPGEDELSRSEINCPFCDEPIQKGAAVCPKCSKALPGFGVETVKGRRCCQWCKSVIKKDDQKFCTWCSGPLRP